MATSQVHILLMRAGQHRFGVDVDSVERVFARVAIRPLPMAPGAVCGIINVHGTIAPVIDLQRRFAHRDAAADTGGRLVSVRTSTRLVVLLCDDVEGIATLQPGEIAAMTPHIPGAKALPDVAIAGKGVIYIYEPDLLLLVEEEASLALAVQSEA